MFKKQVYFPKYGRSYKRCFVEGTFRRWDGTVTGRFGDGTFRRRDVSVTGLFGDGTVGYAKLEGRENEISGMCENQERKK